MKRVALYFRVSTADQSIDAQKIELREYCARRGWGDVREYQDQISGAHNTRIGLDMMMADVRRHSIGAVVCVKLDRLGRSLRHLAQIFDELNTHGVALLCPGQGIDTTDDNPAGRLQMHVLMAVAEFERSLISERTKAGLMAARARGAKLGRPKINLTPERVAALAVYLELPPQERPPLSALAAQMKCSVGTVYALTRA